LKTAFKILPEISSEKEYNLLIEVGRGGLSLAWYTLSPLKIEGLFVYHAQQNADDYSLANDLKQLLATEALPPFKTSKICYNFKEGMAVPNAYYDGAAREAMLNDVYGYGADVKYFTEPVLGMGLSYIYRIPRAIDETLVNHFAGAIRQHTNACLIELQKKSEFYCVIYSSYIKCLLFKNEQLQLIQSYDYQTPSDVAYHLLNICELHHISPEAVKVTLSGFIDQQSSLYEEIYRYFLNVKLDELPEDAVLADEIKVYPPHFFSYLINLIQCA